MLAVGGLALVLVSGHPATSAAASRLQMTTGAVEGTVLDAGTGTPVAGAQVSAPDFSLQTTTDAAGRFAWPAIALESDAVPTVVEVTADG
jgi:hypothetical protein